MQTLARRGVQTALVTGGLLVLGTGIAAAEEDVDPDRPASELDGSLTVPVHLDDDTVDGYTGPVVHRDASFATTTTGAVPTGTFATSPRSRDDSPAGADHVHVDTFVPVDITGNAATGAGAHSSAAVAVPARAAITDMAAHGPCTPEAKSITGTDAGSDIQTSGNEAVATGTVARPLTRNHTSALSALGGFASARAATAATAWPKAGDVIDDIGDRGVLSGDLLDVLPVADEVVPLSGLDIAVPAGAPAVLHDVPVAVVRRAVVESGYMSRIPLGDEEPNLSLLKTDGLAPTELPAAEYVARVVRYDPVRGSFSGVLSGLGSRLAADAPPPPAPDLPLVSQLLPATALPLVSQELPLVSQVPAVSQLLPKPVSRPPRLTRTAPAHAFGLGRGPVSAMTDTMPVGRLAPQRLDLTPVTAPLAAVGVPRPGSRPVDFAPIFGDLADDVTTVLPVLPAAPVRTRVPALPRGVDESSLDSTRAALADLFTSRPIS